MQERDSFYIGALLHDIGKFIERAKIAEWQEMAERYVQRGDASRNYAHRRFSAAFIEKFRTKTAIFPDTASETYSLWHHRGNEQDKNDYESINSKGILLKFIRIADDCASAERQEDASLDPQKYYLARLQSIFSEIDLSVSENLPRQNPVKTHYLGLNKLSIGKESLFPESVDPVFPESIEGTPYTRIVKEFVEAFDGIGSSTELLFFLEKYLQAVPAQTPVEINGKVRLSRPDINLYDHLRITAAIALCLYDEWKEGSWKGKDADILNDAPNGYRRKNFPAPCILVSGDVSGIQDFIFNIPSKKAAKSLKGRSFFVQLLTKVCAQYLLDRLKLKPVNLLFNGGGNFFILVPACRKKDLIECQKAIDTVLLDLNLYLALGWVEVGIGDFSSQGGDDGTGFSGKWNQVKQEVNRRKLRKFSTLDVSAVFNPFLQQRNEDNEQDPYAGITSKLNNKSGYSIKPVHGSHDDDWQTPFIKLGYQVEFYDAPQRNGLLFNDTDFEGKWSGFRFAVKGIPEWRDRESIEAFEKSLGEIGKSLDDYEEENEPIRPGKIRTFSQLAAFALIATGTEKLAVLKMDVDNLGKIFSGGLPANLRTPSRMMALSRSMKWFFEGYMNALLGKPEYRDALYTIFSGGDDFFLVGAWHKIFDFAIDLHEEFCEFTGNHPSMTLSAALVVVDEHFPVARFAAIAENRLHEAKYGSLNKNSINVFGETLSWVEYKRAKGIRDKLLEMVQVHGESKAIIQKVLKGCDELDMLHTRAISMFKASRDHDLEETAWLSRQEPVGEKVWRMAYFMRDLKKSESKEIAASIIETYERVVFSAMQGEPVNPMTIGVGARWAELASRKKPKASETIIH
jgi:CRISPR-associated protein Csm1